MGARILKLLKSAIINTSLIHLFISGNKLLLSLFSCHGKTDNVRKTEEEEEEEKDDDDDDEDEDTIEE